jgi:DNA excision repair protein ERCC-2
VRVLPWFALCILVLNNIYDRIKQTDASKLQDEYAKLVEGLQEAENSEENLMGTPGRRASI